MQHIATLWPHYSWPEQVVRIRSAKARLRFNAQLTAGSRAFIVFKDYPEVIDGPTTDWLPRGQLQAARAATQPGAVRRHVPAPQVVQYLLLHWRLQRCELLADALSPGGLAAAGS